MYRRFRRKRSDQQGCCFAGGDAVTGAATVILAMAPEKRVQKELTNICPANKEGVSYALVSKL